MRNLVILEKFPETAWRAIHSRQAARTKLLFSRF